MACLQTFCRNNRSKKKEWVAKSYAFRSNRRISTHNEYCDPKIVGDQGCEKLKQSANLIDTLPEEMLSDLQSNTNMNTNNGRCEDLTEKEMLLGESKPFYGFLKSYSLCDVKQLNAANLCIGDLKQEDQDIKKSPASLKTLKSYPFRFVRQISINRKEVGVVEEDEKYAKPMFALSDTKLKHCHNEEEKIKSLDKRLTVVKKEEDMYDRLISTLKNESISLISGHVKKEEDECSRSVSSLDDLKSYPLRHERQIISPKKHSGELLREEKSEICITQISVLGDMKNFSCEKCDTRFYRYKELMAHKRSCLEEVVDNEPCHKEWMAFKRSCLDQDSGNEQSKEMLTEVATNCGIELGKAIINYECNTCCKGFSLKISVNHNTRLHSEAKPCYCGGKYVPREGCFDSDRKVLSTIKPYLCDICDKSFALQRHLDSHKLIHILRHSIEKPFKCVACHACFADQSSLDTHTICHN